MAIPVPLEMPSPLPVNAKVFDLSYNQNISPVGAGFIQTIDRSGHFWVAQYQTPPLSLVREQTFQAFLDKLRGSQYPFLGYDPRHIFPYFYRTQNPVDGVSAPWANVSGATRVTAVSQANSTINLDRLKSGAKFFCGDYISFKVGNIWRLFRFVEDVTVTAGGSTLLNVSVVPRPPTIAAGLPVEARFVKAPAAMKIVSKVEKNDRVSDIGPVFKFQAAQYIEKATA